MWDFMRAKMFCDFGPIRTLLPHAANGRFEPEVSNAAPSSNWQYGRVADLCCTKPPSPACRRSIHSQLRRGFRCVAAHVTRPVTQRCRFRLNQDRTSTATWSEHQDAEKTALCNRSHADAESSFICGFAFSAVQRISPRQLSIWYDLTRGQTALLSL